MAKAPLPSPELLRKLLSYDPETGVLTWRERAPEHFEQGGRPASHRANNWNVRWAGKPALESVNNQGYRRGPICGVHAQAHRVIWAIMTGAWPAQQIDHVNGIRTDNRWLNLRQVDHVGNGRNAKKKSNNTSGYTGVFWFKSRQRWCASITVRRKHLNLGYFDKIEDAAAARARAEKRFGFSDTHGRRG